MSKGSRFALALVLFWLSFACFYVAFHPGGLTRPGADPDYNPQKMPSDTLSVNADGTPWNGTGPKYHRARNPAEVFEALAMNMSAGGQTSNA